MMELRMRKIARFIRSSSVVFAIALAATPSFAQPAPAKLDPLLQMRVSNVTGRSRVIVRAINPTSATLLAFVVRQLGGVPGRQLPILEALAADVPNVSLPLLAGNPLVLKVSLDRAVRGSNQRTSITVGATSVRQDLGYDGSGVGVAVIDSGIASWHDDLTRPGVPGSQRVDQFVDFVGGRQLPYDDYGHGTHVAGIIAGNGFDSGGARTGIAPGATLLVLKVLDASGRGRISDVIAALDYVVAHRSVFNTRVINLSLGAGVFESYNSDFLTLAAKRAVDQGIVVVASAGNAGKNANGRSVYGGITSPGNAPWVLTVGSLQHAGHHRSNGRHHGLVQFARTDRDRSTCEAGSRCPRRRDRVAERTGQCAVFVEATGPAEWNSASVVFALSEFERHEPGCARGRGHRGAHAPGEPFTDAERGQGASAVHGSRSMTGMTPLTEGAGFLDARGAVDLARYFQSPSSVPYPSNGAWSRQLLWGKPSGSRRPADRNGDSRGDSTSPGELRRPRTERPSRGAFCVLRRTVAVRPRSDGGRRAWRPGAASSSGATSRQKTSSGDRCAQEPIATCQCGILP